jgi:hypothetical protein
LALLVSTGLGNSCSWDHLLFGLGQLLSYLGNCCSLGLGGKLDSRYSSAVNLSSDITQSVVLCGLFAAVGDNLLGKLNNSSLSLYCKLLALKVF